MDGRLPMRDSHAHLTGRVCWTRMQAESGQGIEAIIARKELERQAGGGLFFWGVGNAPNRSIRSLAATGDHIDVVFSLMKTRPKLRDVAPTGVLTWQTYIDIHGVEQAIPPHVLVTSRMGTGSGTKRVHYALMCLTDAELRLEDQGPFDPSAYRNISDAGGPVSSSQVTALVARITAESRVSDYRINLRARLAGSYWVRLGRPSVLRSDVCAALMTASAGARDMNCDDWFRMVADIRRIAASTVKSQPKVCWGTR
jgi:hypothetical protein